MWFLTDAKWSHDLNLTKAMRLKGWSKFIPPFVPPSLLLATAPSLSWVILYMENTVPFCVCTSLLREQSNLQRGGGVIGVYRWVSNIWKCYCCTYGCSPHLWSQTPPPKAHSANCHLKTMFLQTGSEFLQARFYTASSYSVICINKMV